MNYASDTEGAGRTVSEMTSHGGKAIVLQAEVARAADVQRMCEATTHVFGAVDVLVNNTGVLQCEPCEAMTEQECHREFDTNVLGPILAIQEALQHFPASGGSIITISSIASEHLVPHSSLNAATKGAIDTLTLALAKELESRNIRVNAVAPGHTETEGTRRIGLVGSAQARQRVAATPLGGRFGQPEDIAPVVVFLASDEAVWLTGERISASGGARESRARCFGRVRGNGRLVMGSPQGPSGDERRPAPKEWS
jgi:3-oxoacyl-[acyl-carrier protein] reductase